MRIVLFLILCISFSKLHAQLYSTVNGQVDFVSDAPLELIKASSGELQGILDIEKKTFAFKMFIKSFEGFNSPLQQIHFYENYMETSLYPTATFTGKILEKISSDRSVYRAKGNLTIHGVKVERIIEVQLNFQDKSIAFNSTFTVPLADHAINLPRIVYQKIAEEILVTVKGELNPRS